MSSAQTRTDNDDIRFARYHWDLKLSDMREIVSDKSAAKSTKLRCETKQVFAGVYSHGCNQGNREFLLLGPGTVHLLSKVQPCWMSGGSSDFGMYRN